MNAALLAHPDQPLQNRLHDTIKHMLGQDILTRVWEQRNRAGGGRGVWVMAAVVTSPLRPQTARKSCTLAD